jgi:hypothetical protein
VPRPHSPPIALMEHRSQQPALGEETIPSDESRHIEELVAIHRDIQEHTDRLKRPVPRNVHPKQHGCVRAEFMIAASLPSHVRFGLFREPRVYPAVVRFSNAKQTNDELPDGHGMAIKLFGVEGEKLLEAERHATTHDFILIDHPVFFARNVADMVALMHDFRRLMLGGAAAKALTVLKAAASLDYRFRLLRRAGAKRPHSPLDIQYWSTTPFKLGGGAMKFSLRPQLDRLPAPRVNSPDKLRLAMSAHLREHDALFDFLIQRQTDPAATPLEDPSQEWNEAVLPYEKVAVLRIPRQNFESPAQMKFGEDLSFTPWHALAEHRPLGGINRARKHVYEAMSRRRHELNQTLQRELTLEEVRTVFPESI